MTAVSDFQQWVAGAARIDPSELLLADAFTIAVCRIEAAANAGAKDPITAVSNSASQSSRSATKTMLAQLGYTCAQTRIMQRILAGSTGGWPGLIRLYVDGRSLSEAHRRYLVRQVRAFLACGVVIEDIALGTATPREC